MNRNYLIYWRPRNVASRLARYPLLDHAGSNQFCHVEVGDVLWFCTVREGKLFLVGRLIVGKQADFKEAEALLGTNKVAENSRFVVFAQAGTEERMREIPADDIVARIRFESTGNDRLTIKKGRLNPQQMQTKRRLTNLSAELVRLKWNNASPTNPAP